MRRGVLCLGCLLLPLLCAASAPPEPVNGDWVVYADAAEPTTLDCARVTERIGRQICRLVADTLIDFDEQFHFVPRLAESYDVSPDGLTITFHLRKSVQWHDGVSFSARDVLHTVETIRHLDDHSEAYKALFGPLRDVTAPDELTVRAVYLEPYALALASWRETFILPAHVTGRPEGASAYARAPIGTGPFRFMRWDPQQQIVLSANKDYFGGRPRLDRYIQRIIPSAEGLRAAAQSGDVDVAPLSPEWAVTHSPPDPNLPFAVTVMPTSVLDLIYWNISERRGLFTDARVRQALSMLVDRAGYAARVQHGYARPVATLIDSQIWGGDPALSRYAFDPAAAARLLDEAGIKDKDGDGIRDTPGGPMSFTLIYSGQTSGHLEIGSLFERAAAQAGVRVKLQSLEWPVMRTKIREHQFEAAIHRLRLEPIPDPYSYVHSSQVATGFNYGAYRNPEIDRLSVELRRTFDTQRAAGILSSMQRLLHEDEPFSVIVSPSAVMAISRRLRIPDVKMAGLWNWYPSILSWWVPAAERKYR